MEDVLFFFLDTDGLVCQALLTGNFEAAVDVCFNDKRMADGLLLAIAGGPDLFARTQKRYLAQAQSTVSKVSFRPFGCLAVLLKIFLSREFILSSESQFCTLT